MFPRHRRWISLLIAILMLAAALPAGPTSAATASYFTFPYASDPDSAVASPVNTAVIDKFYGTFSQEVPTNLTYSVQQQVKNAAGQWVDKGVPNVVPNATPVISGPTRQEFYLQNVSLFVGMNKITVSTPTGVEGTCYVFYDDAPVISSITLNNGVPLNPGSPTFVDNGTQFFLIKADNVTSVSVNGVNATRYGPSAYSVSNFVLKPGLNTLTFVAHSDTRDYTITRQVVYLNGPGAVYNVYLQDAVSNPTNKVQLDGGNIVSSSGALPEILAGQIVYPVNSSVDPVPSFTSVSLTRDGTAVFGKTLPDAAITPSFGTPIDDGLGHKIYTFTIDMSGVTGSTGWPIDTNGTYQFLLQGTYFDGTTTKPFQTSIAFTYKDSSKASIANVQQLFGVDPSNNSGGVPGPFSSRITELPIYALVSVQNNGGTFTPKLSVTQNGQTVNLAEGSGKDFEILQVDVDAANKTGTARLKINQLPFQGDMQLNFAIDDGGKIDNYPPISINYNPVPSIVLFGIYDGDNYEVPDLPAFSGKLINFIGNDKDSIKVYVNGGLVPYTLSGDGRSFDVAQQPKILAEGPNEVKVTGTAQGIPVTTRLTVYYYRNDAPVVDKPFPVPVPVSGPRNTSDPNGLFQPDAASASTYNTTEKKADILIHVTGADKLIVMRDGVQFFTIDYNDDGTLKTSMPLIINGITIDLDTALLGYIRIQDYPLNLGSNSFVVKATKGPITTSVPMTIVRNSPPFQVLSPKLPEERVVNQNFLKVEISAEGADSVLIGKTPMTKVTENGLEYFVGTVDNLKPGKNTIKYTVVQGTQKTNNQFDVVYANTNTIGAEYRSTLGNSGKITAFNKALTLSFPKGTMLTPLNDDGTKIELFDNQNILAGIADPVDGRTVKTYNHFGNIMPINPSPGILQTLLTVPNHFGYASPLYWIDAGYFDANGYVQNDGMHPYYGDELSYTDPLKPFDQFNVWNRSLPSSWMKTTQRGTITLQYDPAVRNAAADRLSIWRFGLDGDSMRWTNIGGKVNTSAHTVTASIDSFGYYAVFYNTFGFDDTQNHDFARDDMELLFARGIMNAKNGGEFGAYEPTTRGEFATILVKALDLPLNYDPNNLLFYDVPTSLYASPYWDYRYIETAGQKGIVRGIGPRQFAPDDPVTREQAAIMIATALNLKMNTDYDKAKANLDKIFSDSGKIDVYSRAAVEAVYKAKLMQGRTVANPDPNGKPLLVFDPQSNITRAETAKVIANMMRLKKML